MISQSKERFVNIEAFWAQSFRYQILGPMVNVPSDPERGGPAELFGVDLFVDA